MVRQFVKWTQFLKAAAPALHTKYEGNAVKKILSRGLGEGKPE
jgi:hypothetical protein